MVEGALAVPGATTEVARHLERLAPFGAGNEEPTLVLNAPALCGPTGWDGRRGRSGRSWKARAAGRG